MNCRDCLHYEACRDVYDELAYVYDAEHGKKLIDDYDKIVEDFRDKIEEKINNVRRDEKRAQFELLKKELEEADNV